VGEWPTTGLAHCPRSAVLASVSATTANTAVNKQKPKRQILIAVAILLGLVLVMTLISRLG
jgi:hypothetical protein